LRLGIGAVVDDHDLRILERRLLEGGDQVGHGASDPDRLVVDRYYDRKGRKRHCEARQLRSTEVAAPVPG
jgi:hypothetical protein